MRRQAVCFQVHRKHGSKIEGCLPRRYMPDELPTVDAAWSDRFPRPPQYVSEVERAARQFCFFAAKTSCLPARWRGDGRDWKQMRLIKEGVDNLGFKRQRLKFQGKREGKAGEVFWKCQSGPVPYQWVAFARCPPQWASRRRRFRYGL